MPKKKDWESMALLRILLSAKMVIFLGVTSNLFWCLTRKRPKKKIEKYKHIDLSALPVVVVGYPAPSEGWGHGGRPWSPRSRATPQGLDQRSYRDR